MTKQQAFVGGRWLSYTIVINVILKTFDDARNAESSKPWFKLQVQVGVNFVRSVRLKKICIPYIVKNAFLQGYNL